MTRIFFSDWELNVIQVGLNHVQDEFDFLTEKQKGLSGDIVMDLDRYRKRDKDSDSDKYGFKLTHSKIMLITMATTEIYLMHTDLKIQAHDDLHGMTHEDILFSKEVIKACETIFKKLLKGCK